MRIIKPQHLSVLHRCFERQQRAYLGVAVIGFMPLQSDAALLPEQELWQVVPPLLGDMPLDTAIPKSGGEFVVSGDACAARGKPAQGLKVSVSVGKQSKLLYVLGERTWQGSTATAPVPFERMPLDWAHAYGGPAFALNPHGRGHAPVQVNGNKSHPLPCIEHPHNPSVKPGEPIAPACFEPLQPMSLQRKQFDGTCDDAWLQQDYPGPPKDFDWRYHCVAPQDQWQPDAYSGKEPIELAHMHPDHQQINVQLPGIAPVIGVRRKGEGEDRLSFLQARLTTIWLFPNQLRMALIWHAMVQTADEFASELDLLLIGAEWQDKPRGDAHYLKALNERMDSENGALKMLDDEELLPQGLATPNPMLERHQQMLGSSGISLGNAQERLRTSQAELNDKLISNFGKEAVEQSQQELARTKLELGLPDLPAKLIL
jgi:hypothetical protein